jgi:hypothetical protein
MPAQGLSIGPGNIGDAPYPIVLAIQGSELPSMALLEAKSAAGSSSSVPIPADPGLILSYDREAWRDERYEVFRWVQFPSILIFDTADYAIQERLFKRLAFFVEKAGFRGRLAKDEEIAHLHGWNAHDYRSEDLAAFYELALRTQFPLNREELELRDLLLDTGVLERGANGSGFRAGSGAVISISRESESYLRHLFMVHEAFHGLHFIDADFREFARNRYENLDPTAKRFVHSYFSFLRYDVKDSYLMSNELMAYCLQQPVAGAAAYFGEIVARRLDTDPLRRSVLPPKDTEAGNWPEIARLFDGEARAFSSYAEKRWGLAAGRVWSVYQISRAKLTL